MWGALLCQTLHSVLKVVNCLRSHSERMGRPDFRYGLCNPRAWIFSPPYLVLVGCCRFFLFLYPGRDMTSFRGGAQ